MVNNIMVGRWDYNSCFRDQAYHLGSAEVAPQSKCTDLYFLRGPNIIEMIGVSVGHFV